MFAPGPNWYKIHSRKKRTEEGVHPVPGRFNWVKLIPSSRRSARSRQRTHECVARWFEAMAASSSTFILQNSRQGCCARFPQDERGCLSPGPRKPFTILFGKASCTLSILAIQFLPDARGARSKLEIPMNGAIRVHRFAPRTVLKGSIGEKGCFTRMPCNRIAKY
jgi:hypothetical protein